MTGNVLKDAPVVAAPDPFAALADELQSLAGNGPSGRAYPASANGQQGNFTAADRRAPSKAIRKSR